MNNEQVNKRGDRPKDWSKDSEYTQSIDVRYAVCLEDHQVMDRRNQINRGMCEKR